MQLGRASRQTCHMWNGGFPSGVWQGRSDPGPTRSQTMRKERAVAPARLRARGAFLPESRSTFQCFTTFGYSHSLLTTGTRTSRCPCCSLQRVCFRLHCQLQVYRSGTLSRLPLRMTTFFQSVYVLIPSCRLYLPCANTTLALHPPS